jgi:hypothetical protein
VTSPAWAVDYALSGNVGPSFGKDEGVTIDPANGDLFVIEAEGVNERQQLSYSNLVNGDTFTIGNLPAPPCASATTDPIVYSASPFVRRNNIRAAVEAKCDAGSIAFANNTSDIIIFQGPLGSRDIPLVLCSPLTGAGSCEAETTVEGQSIRLFRLEDDGTPRNFPALGTNVIDGRAGLDQTPQSGVFGSTFAPGEVQVAVAPPGSVGGTAGNIYLTNASNELVDIFAADGTFLGQLTAADATPLGEVCGVAVDPGGAVYLGDRSGQVRKYVPTANPPVNGDHVASFPFAQACTIAAGVGPTAGFVFPTHFGGAVEKLDSSTGAAQYVVSAAPNTTVSVDGLTGRVWAASGNEARGFEASGPAALPFATIALGGAIEGLAAQDDDVFLARASASRIEIHTPLPDQAPLASTGEAGAGADPSLTTLGGEIDPQGFKLTECRFEYGTTTAYGTSVPCDQSTSAIGRGNDPVAVSASTEPLEPGTTYHYRLRAANLAQGATGADRTFTSAPSAADACPNAAIRAEQGPVALRLPDCMALEMVSPPQKDTQAAKDPHLSADGNRAMFHSLGCLADCPSVMGLTGNPYVASRGAEGWGTEPTRAPAPYFAEVSVFTMSRAAIINQASVVPMSVTPDFGCWFHLAATKAQAEVGVTQVFRGCLGGLFEPFSPLLTPINPTGPIGEGDTHARFQAASADHSHFFFQPIAPPGTSYLLSDPVPSGSGAVPNAYVARPGPGGEPLLELVARGRDAGDGKVKVWGGNCGAFVGGPVKRTQGAVSAEGTRTYFSTRPAQPASGNCSESNKLRILERLETPTDVLVRELFPSPPGVGDDRFQGASQDQSKVYFTTNRQLANSDLDSGSECSAAIGASAACDLYLYDSSEPAGERVIQVSAGEDVPGKHQVGKEAKVLDGTVAISADGSHVYFAAQGALTNDPSPEGKSAAEYPAIVPKLYLYQRDSEHPGGELSFIGPLDPGDRTTSGSAGLWGGPGTFTNDAYPVPASGDGHVLLFISRAPLTADDEDGSRRDVFRYDADADELVRVSKAAGGADNGPFEVGERGKTLSLSLDSLGTEFAEVGRWVGEDGGSVIFSSAESLGRGDGDGSADTYLWREGALTRLPSAIPSSGATISGDGGSVAFATNRKLLPIDGDGAGDVYLARVGGGFPNPVAVVPCQPDQAQPGPHCRNEPPAPPSAPSSASATLIGAGNPKPRTRPCPKGKLRRAKRCLTTRQVAQRICAKRKGRAKRRCLNNQARRLNRAQARQRRATNANRRAAR